jgi:hypothetical protein
LKKYLSILFLFCTFSIKAQTYTYSYTDPCTGVLKTLSVPINGSIAVSYYGETSSFTGIEFQNGTFENWANQVLAQYQNISPCAQIVGVSTAVNVSQSTVINTIGILNSLSAIADLAGSTNILGGATTTVAGGTNNNSNNNKQNKNGNNSNSNSGGSNGTSGSNGSNPTNPITTTGSSEPTSTPTTSPSEPTQQSSGTSSTGSGENGGTTSSTGTEGGTSGGSQTTNPEGTTSNPSTESTSGSSSSTATEPTTEGSTETGATSSTEGSSQSSTTGNGSGGQGEQTETQETPTTQEEGGQTNITGGSTTTIRGSTTTSGSSKSKEGGKPSVVASSDFVGFNFQDSEVTTGLKVTGGYTSLRWDGKRSWGVLADYTSALKGPNITGFNAWIKPKTITILSATATIGFEGTGSLYGTLSGGQMFSFEKVKNLKVIYMATVSYGAVFRTQFLGTAVIAGGMYDLKVGKRLDIKFTDLMVYSPYVSYYNDIVMKSPYVMIPSIGVNIGITKKFKFNINAGGAWSLGNSTLNYTVTCGTRLMVGQ